MVRSYGGRKYWCLSGECGKAVQYENTKNWHKGFYICRKCGKKYNKKQIASIQSLK